MTEKRILQVAVRVVIITICASCSCESEKSESPTIGSPVLPRPAATVRMNNLNADEDRLPGSKKSLSDALRAADLIVIASVSHIPARGDVDAPGKSYFSPIEIDIEKVLKGHVSGKMTVGISIRTFPKEDAEAIPREGDRLLLLLRSEGHNPAETVKILRPTDQNIKACSQGLNGEL